jgi:hypothetical protein
LGVSVTEARGGGGACFVAAPGVGRPAPLTEGIDARAGGGCGALRSAGASLPAPDGMGARAGGTAARETAASLEAIEDMLGAACVAAVATAEASGTG